MGKITNSKDLLMLLLYARGANGRRCEPIRGRTRLMKMVFLFDEEIRRQFNLDKVITEAALPDFTPYDFGPFSANVFDDLEFLVGMGFIQPRLVGELPEEEAEEYAYWQASSATGDDDPGAEAEEEFALSAIGRGFVEDELMGSLSEQQWQVLDEFKARCAAMPLRTLLRYVYGKYPQTTTKSRIREEILSEDRRG